MIEKRMKCYPIHMSEEHCVMPSYEPFPFATDNVDLLISTIFIHNLQLLTSATDNETLRNLISWKLECKGVPFLRFVYGEHILFHNKEHRHMHNNICCFPGEY